MTDTVRSMTGFGTAPFEVAGARYRVKLRSVNHRNLNIRTHLPSGFSHTEGALKRLLRDRVVRGSVDVSVTLEDHAQRAVEVIVDQVGAQAMKGALDALAEGLGIEGPKRLDLILRQGDFVTLREEDVAEEAMTEALIEGLSLAVERLEETRRVEGAELAADLGRRLETLLALVNRLEEASPKIYAAYEARLRQRLEEVATAVGQAADEGRIASELVLFSDRCDVTEETVRARAHITTFQGHLQGGDGDVTALLGKRLEFLTQELGREFNTIGSKCREAGMTHDVVEAKVELERIREQVLNIA